MLGQEKWISLNNKKYIIYHRAQKHEAWESGGTFIGKGFMTY